MKQSIVYSILAGIIIIGGFFIYNRTADKDSMMRLDESKPVIAATIFPVADIAQHVAGDILDVFAILPPGASPHTFEARPSDLQKIQKADQVFAIGYGLDDWVLALVGDSRHEVVFTVDVDITLQEFAAEHEDEEMHDENFDGHDEHEHDHEGIDPHYWLSFANAEVITRTVQKELSMLYPEYADQFEANAEAYITDLQIADQSIRDQLSKLGQKELITFHDSWNYFAQDYNFEIVGVFEPAPGKEPSPQYLKELHDTARENAVAAVFTEPQLASDVVEPFIEDLGLQIYTLDPLGGFAGRNSYIKLMQYNAQTLYDALSN